MRLDRNDLIHQLNLKLNSLVKLALDYDKGEYFNAIDMSTIIRVLVHDTSNSKSLFEQLNSKHVNFVNTSEGIRQSYNKLPHYLLVKQTINPKFGIHYNPFLNKGLVSKHSFFERWWNEIVIIIPEHNLELSRKDLTLKLANKYGAHIATDIPRYYHDLFNANDEMIGFSWFKGSEKLNHLQTPIFPTIRQIGHELLQTIDNEFEEINITQNYFSKIITKDIKLEGISNIVIGTPIKSNKLKEFENMSEKNKQKSKLKLSDVFFDSFSSIYPKFEINKIELNRLIEDIKPYSLSEKTLIEYCENFQPHLENYKKDVSEKLGDQFNPNGAVLLGLIIWMNNDDYFNDIDPPHNYQVLRKKYNSLF